WSSSPLNSDSSAPKSEQTFPITSSAYSRISSVNVPRRYLVTNTKWTWQSQTACLPLRMSLFSAIHLCYYGEVLKRYRYRAYPTVEQASAAARTFGCVRVVFNDFLARRRDLRQEGRYREVPFSETVKDVTTRAKLTPERAWLSEVSNTPLQQSVRDAERAYRNWFDSLSGKRRGRRVGHPRFKSRRDRSQSARFTRNCGFSVRETTHGVGFVRLPKIGQVRFALSRPLPSEPSSVTLTRSASGRWYVSFVVEVPDPDPLPETSRVAGIDLGLTDLATIVSSDGTREKIAAPRHLRAKERKLARAQRELARRQKGSANRE